MRKITKIILSIILSGSLLLDATVSYAQNTTVSSETIKSETTGAPKMEMVPGEVLVAYEGEGEPVQSVSELIESEISDIAIESTELIAEDVGEDEKDVVIFEVKDDRQVQELIDQLNEQEGITAQPNYIYHAFETTERYQAEVTAADVFAGSNDTSAAMQYYLNDYNERGTGSGAGVYTAWRTAKVEKSVTVAVLDTGCDINHPDLKDNIDTLHMWDVYNETSKMSDGHGHGTHVCGIVGAVADNGIGIAGASYNAAVLPIKVFDDNGEGALTSDIVKAYNYLGKLIGNGELNNLHVINLSLGGYGSKSEDDYVLEQIISDFRENYQVLTVAAGGNGKDNKPLTDYCMPSDFDCVLSVTSLDENGGNTVWSDYNIYKDISAPGENIYSTYRNSGYAWMSGTSMAAPLVSGIAALLFAAVPGTDPDAVVDAIKSTAHSMAGKANDRGSATGSAGAIDAAAAMAKLTGKPVNSDLNNPEMGEITLIDEPAASKKLVYNGRSQQGIPQGEGYELTGQTSAVKAGNYTVYATLKPGYRWRNDPDNTNGKKRLTWSIAKKEAVISANNASKVYGEKDPSLTASISGVITGEIISCSLEREKGEDVGNYVIRVIEGNNPNYQVTSKPAVFTIYAASKEALPATGSKHQVSKLIYRVTSSTESAKKVSVVKPVKKTNKKITIPATVKINGYSYKVTGIDKKAFYKNKKLTQVVIGKNVTNIGKQAFYSSSKLKKVDIKANKLSTVGKNAFAKISKKAVIYVPKKKLKTYKAKLKKAKTIKSAKIVKK